MEGGAKRQRAARRSDSDLRLAARAVRELWPVPEDRRAELVTILFDAAKGPPGKDRSVAVRALVDMSRNNVEALRAAGELDYADVVRAIEELRRAQLGEAPPRRPAADGGSPGPGTGGR